VQCAGCRWWVHGGWGGVGSGLCSLVGTFVEVAWECVGVNVGVGAGLELVDGFCFLG